MSEKKLNDWENFEIATFVGGLLLFYLTVVGVVDWRLTLALWLIEQRENVTINFRALFDKYRRRP